MCSNINIGGLWFLSNMDFQFIICTFLFIIFFIFGNQIIQFTK